MKNIKILRQHNKYTQSELAKMLNTTQQNVARWETGISKPPIDTLKDLQMIFKVSLNEIISDKKPILKKYHDFFPTYKHGSLEATNAFWGDVGFKIPNSNDKLWFRISSKNYIEARQNIQLLYSQDEFENTDLNLSVIETLEHQTVFLVMQNLNSIDFQDDAGDSADQWDYYKDRPLLENSYLELVADYYHEPEKFNKETSDKLKKIISEDINNFNWGEDGTSFFRKYYYTTKVYFKDGSMREFNFNERDLNYLYHTFRDPHQLKDDLALGMKFNFNNHFVVLDDDDGQEIYLSKKNISLIIVPNRAFSPERNFEWEDIEREEKEDKM